MIFDPAVVVLDRHTVPVDAAPVLPHQRPRRGELQGEGQVGAGTRIDGLVGGVARKRGGPADVVRTARGVDEVVVPVLEVVRLPVERVVEHEIVVRPFQARTQADSGAIDLHILAVVQHLIIIGGVRVGLTREVGRYVEGSRFLAGQPGFHEVGREGGVVGTVGLEADGEGLRVTQRNRAPGLLPEEVGGGEVVEAHAHRSHEHSVAPAAGEFQLAVGLLLHGVRDVHRVGVGVRDQVVALPLLHRELGVEMSHRGNLTDRTLEIGLAVEVARAGEDGAADHFLVGDRVAVDDDVVKSRRLAFHQAHLHVHGVAFDGQLHGRDVEEEEAVVAIELADGDVTLLLAGIEAFLHRHHVVHVSFLDAQHFVERLFGVLGVAGPRDVAEIIFLALVDDEVDAETAVFRDAVERIFHDLGIAVARLVEDFQHLLLVTVKLFFLELLGREQVVPLGILGLLHRPVELELLDLVVSFVGDFLDLKLLALIDIEGHTHGVTDERVVGHFHFHVHVGKAFLLEIVLDGLDGGCLHILRERRGAAQVEFLLQVVALAVLDTAIGPGDHAGTLLDIETEPGRIAAGTEGIHIKTDVGSGALQPDTLDGRGHVVARHSHGIARTDAQHGQDLVLTQVFDA